MDPKLSYFNTFLTAAKTKSFSKASKKLNVTQGTVSNHISTLEKYFDAQLFLRTPEGVDLTPEGKMLYKATEKVLDTLNDAKQNIRLLHENPEGTVRIMASTTPGENILPNIIQSYRMNNKDVNFDVRIEDSEKCFKSLEQGYADIIAVGNLYDKSYEYVIIGKDRLVLIVPPNHELANRKSVKLSEVLKQSFISREEGSGTRESFYRALTEKGYSPMDLDIAMILGSNSSVITAVAEGYGVSVISEIPAKHGEDSGQIKIIPIEDLDLTRYLYLVKGRKPGNPSAVKSFWDYINE